MNTPITFTPIGIIHSPYATLEGMPIQPSGAKGVQGRVEVFVPYQEGLADLDGFSHIVLIYHFHGSTGFNLKVVPFLDKVERGLFATRAPKRPNPIGLSVVRLLAVEGSTLAVENIDVLDGTPLLDIKPYVPQFDAQDDVRTGWLESVAQNSARQRSDDRFTETGRPLPNNG